MPLMACGGFCSTVQGNSPCAVINAPESKMPLEKVAPDGLWWLVQHSQGYSPCAVINVPKSKLPLNQKCP